MNRKEAQNHIGKLVIIDELTNGRYIGKLLEVHAEPRKPWLGEIEIVAVDTYPKHSIQQDGTIELSKPIYNNGTIISFHSSKIEPFPEENYIKYEDSIYKAILSAIESFQSEKEYVNAVLNILHERLDEINPDTEKDKSPIKIHDEKLHNEYIYYTVKKEQDTIILEEANNNQHLSTDVCPFEFELRIQEEWKKGFYLDKGLFKGKGRTKYPLKVGQKVRLHKKQLDPYHILIHELDNPALKALLKGLNTFNITHEQCIQCHNSLLKQIINSHQQASFKGVNFITYHNGERVILVQHHYERELIQDDNDVTFDRFEFTSDDGKRIITTYSNEFTRGK